MGLESSLLNCTRPFTQFQEFDIQAQAERSGGLSQYPTNLLVKMIQVFEAAVLCTIKDGVMTVNVLLKREIAESQIYQNLKIGDLAKDREMIC